MTDALTALTTSPTEYITLARRIDAYIAGEDTTPITFAEMRRFLELFDNDKNPHEGWVIYCLASVNQYKSNDCFFK